MISRRFALLLAAFTMTALPCQAAPELSATLTSTTLSVDVDGDGRADEGDSIRYEGTVTNTGDSTATNVTITTSDDPELTVNPASIFSNVIAMDDNLQTDEDTPLTIAAPGVLGNDIDYPLPVSLTVVQTTATAVVGQVTVQPSGALTYDPDGQFESLAEGQTATETLTYAATDAHDNVDTATVTITVQGVNDAPVALAQSVTTDEDNPVEITLAGTDVDDGAILEFSIVSGPLKGSLGAITAASDTTAKVTFDPEDAFQNLAAGQSEVVTFTFNVSDGDASGTPATVTITVTGVNDAPVPGADTYSVTGNTTLEIGGTEGNSGAFVYTRDGSANLLLNDTDPDDGATLAAVAETVVTTAGGSVTIRADGSFFYAPPAGFTGNDTFAYQVTDGTATVSQTVTLEVAGRLWYIHNGLAGADNGTSQNPFTSLASFNAANTGDPGKPQNNDFIYLVGTGTNYTNGITLRNGQFLHGSGMPLDRDGVTQPAGTTPRIINTAGPGITLGSGNTINAVEIRNAAGTAIRGASVGGLTIVNTSISNNNGGALDIANGTVNILLGTVGTSIVATHAFSLTNINGSVIATGGALANASQETFYVNGGTANIEWQGSITNTSNRSISVMNKTSGTVTFSGSISDTGGGISLTNNPGATINFTGRLTLNTGTSPAFTATGGGTINATNAFNTVTVHSATAVNVSNTTIGSSGLTFRSISSTAGSNGIVLQNTGSGTFSVTGDGASSAADPTRGRTTVGATGQITPGSGGTINHPSESAILLTNTGPVVLQNMVVQNGNSAANNTRGGIVANSVAGLTLDNMRVAGFSNISGLRANGGAGLNIIHCQFFSNASDGSVGGHFPTIDNVNLTNVTGAVSIQSSSLDITQRNLIEINQTAGAQTLSVTNCNILQCNAGTGLSVIADSNATVNSTIQNNTFRTGTSSWGLNLTTQNLSAANMHCMVRGNSFTTNFVGVNIASGTSAIHEYVVSANNFLNHPSVPININRLGSVDLFPYGIFSGVIISNTIGTAGVPNSGTNANGIDVKTNGNNGVIRVSILNNTIRNVGESGIRLTARDANIGHTLHAKIHNNDIAQFRQFGLSGIAVVMGALDTDKLNICLDILSNIVANAPQNGIRVRSSGLPAAQAALTLRDWDGTTPVLTYLANRNPGAIGALGNTSFSNGSGTTNPGFCIAP